MTDLQARVDGVSQWHHTMDLPGGIRTRGRYDPQGLWNRLQLPDLSGKRVLDVGTRDGFYAFQCERRGAEVVAIDVQPSNQTGFSVAYDAFQSKVEFRLMDVYEVTPEALGTFDVVLFLGVLYHLRYPLLALDRLRPLCTGSIAVETLAMNVVWTGGGATVPLAKIAPKLKDIPVAQYLEAAKYFPSDRSNWWAPNVACLQAIVADAGFTVFDTQSWGTRALVRASV